MATDVSVGVIGDGDQVRDGRSRGWSGKRQPIAIVGMACRFPGADSVEAFWRLLANGVDAVMEGEPGSGVGRIGRLFGDAIAQNEACRFGAYLDQVDEFDAGFFRISPIEAQFLDPQQRLMLETSWQALEDAAIDPEVLVGSRTGVYGGISNNEYRQMIMESSDTSEPAASLYTVSGTSYNTAIGRVSYALGFQGPAIAIDTACSSSLVAIHQAVTGLQHGEADLALAGGVHTILSGRLLELRGNAGMLAPDGRCKTYDASANGYVRGEGCGVLVLKRLGEAEAHGDRIWGVIKGSALNQDGASQGLTVPSAEAQRLVIEDALTRSGVRAQDVDYVEAHGTGTPVGDPIEMEALGAAYGTDRDRSNPLLVGSVKTNFGHLESAAGVAGVMKTVLAMKHGVIPKHLHFKSPNPEIDWENLAVQVTAEATDWPDVAGRKRLAGVSGFGWSGTNAHVILEGYGAADGDMTDEGEYTNRGAPVDVSVETTGPLKVSLSNRSEHKSSPSARARNTRVLPLSGKTQSAVKDLAAGYVSWLDAHPSKVNLDLADVAWTAGVGRSHFECRTGVTFNGDGLESLKQRLSEVVAGNDADPAVTDRSVAFVYTGQGSQWVGMGETLYRREPVVRAVLDRCEEVMLAERGISLLAVMFGRPEAQGELDDTAWTQPAVYALECALTALWSTIGIKPSVVIGHSLGEFAAAQAAGVFGLEDGLRFVAKRGALLSSVPELGGMAAIFAAKQEVEQAVRDLNAMSGEERLCVAVDNGVHQVVSGPEGDIETISEQFEAQEVLVRRLRNQAFHSALIEPALNELEEAYESVPYSAPEISLISNVTGRVVANNEKLDAGYWRRHARHSVQFQSGIDTMADLGVDLVIEVGPNAVLGPLISMAWPETITDGVTTQEPVVLASLLRNYEELPPEKYDDGFVTAVARAYEAGLAIEFEGLFAGESRRRISLPSYPFQRNRYWVDPPKRRRESSDHPLLGARHESPRGEVSYETKMFHDDPSWLSDHRVFGRVIMPGAFYAAMAAAVVSKEQIVDVEVEDLQLQRAMLFAEGDGENDRGDQGRLVQLVLENAEEGLAKRFEIYSKDDDEDEWTLHAAGELAKANRAGSSERRSNLDAVKSRLQPRDVGEFYAEKSSGGIDFGPTFRSVDSLWSGDGEAIGEIRLAESLKGAGLDAHPVLLDGCFQVLSAARATQGAATGDVDGAAYLPFAWERMWLSDALPDRVVCHVRIKDRAQGANGDEEATAVAETFTGDLRLYSMDGVELGDFEGYAVKRATRSALLAGTEQIDDLLYEVIWRDRALEPGTVPADFLPSPANVALSSTPFTDYLSDQGVDPNSRTALLTDLERLSWSYALAALECLGWTRVREDRIDSEELRRRFNVLPEHSHVFRRMFELLSRAGVVREDADGFVVAVGQGDSLPENMPADGYEFAQEMLERYDHGSTEVGLFSRCAAALADVLTGQADPLTLLFSSGSPSAADLYLVAPVAQAANRMLSDAVTAMLANLPDDRTLRVLEVGAGTGSATASILPVLPPGRYEYVYSDISAGFFAEAESRFGGAESAIDYRVLDIEKSAVAQGFQAHGYDLIIASNVLHATRYLNETLENCLELLAPSGLLVALENLRGQGWLDLTFGQLDGWWRFADEYRPHHALASPEIWEQALDDAGFEGVAVLGPNGSSNGPNGDQAPDRGVIVAQGPVDVVEPPGTWIVASDRSGFASTVARALGGRNQQVVVAGDETTCHPVGVDTEANIVRVSIDQNQRTDWRKLLEDLPDDSPVNGIVHMVGMEGHGAGATSHEFAEDVRSTGGSALALTQALLDADISPAKGFWFVTRGGQALEHISQGEISGALVWGFGKVVDREAAHLQTRMIDLDPSQQLSSEELVDELLHPDDETHIAYRYGHRQVARLVRVDEVPERLNLPDNPLWLVQPDEDGDLQRLTVDELRHHPLAAYEIRVDVLAAGLNFWDLFRSLGVIDEGILGGEFCGRVLEIGSEVTTFGIDDLVVGLAFGTFGSQVVTHQDMVAHAARGMSITGLATIPTAFVSAQLSYDATGLNEGDRVLIHAGAGGVGMAAVQLAKAAGAEVYATASKPKQDFLRFLGVNHVFDSRSTYFGQQILDNTNSEGVDIVLNSLTGEGFIPASLSCLKPGGRFVELARVDILSESEMAEVRPDVSYKILRLDELKEHHPAEPGDALRRVMDKFAAGEIEPIVHTRWSMNEAGSAMKYMGAARHIGKIVLANSPIEGGRLRVDRTYVVTGGLGGIGTQIAQWLSENGAGAIVLNGRRNPDPDAVVAIDELRRQGANIHIELADVTDADAVDSMFARIEDALPPIGGVIHSVGVLSDASLMNQSWEGFERVLWPKVLGAWHLHRATLDRDLDMFVLFSSVAGVLGNAGQANHAAANAFLDQLAAHRRSLGLAGQAIAWGAWSDLGEAEEQRERIAEQLEAIGTGWISPRQGIRAFEAMMRQNVTSGVVAAVDWEILATARDGSQALISEMISDADDATDIDAVPAEDVLTRLRGKPLTQREEVLIDFLQDELQAVMRLPNKPATQVGFFDLGMDSLMAVEMRNRLNRAFEGEYSASNTIVFDYPNVAELSRHLAAELDDLSDEPQVFSLPVNAAPLPEIPPEPAPSDLDGIAIVGMACRFPGARNIDEFWQLLESGKDAVTDGRPDDGSWDGTVGDRYAEREALRKGAFLDRIDEFDSRFFRISPIEARMMDPQQRILLETTWHAVEDAGIDSQALRGSRTGVYVGIGTSEYRDVMAAKGIPGDFLGTTPSVAVGRVAFALGLEGPAVPVDLVCAASLASIHHAVKSLEHGEVDMALAGGVNTVLSAETTKYMTDLGILSPNGESRPFDAGANGYVRGEGCGMLVLKRLRDAEADGDNIWGVILGSAVNQNGSSAGLTVPNGSAQQRVMRDALRAAGVNASEIDYYEAHGGASQLGDPIELQAAAAVYGDLRTHDQPLHVGSVKANLGHLERAAGVASLIKVVLAMKNRKIPKQLNFDEPNPHVEWSTLPLQIPTENTDWPDRPPRAAISGFAISGANAHLVVGGFNAEIDPSVEHPPETLSRTARVLPLSGRSESALRDLARLYLEWLDTKDASNETNANSTLADMAWTAGTCRSHFGHRTGIVFDNQESLREGLHTVANLDVDPNKAELAERSRVALAYRESFENQIEELRELYVSEPVFRSEIDRCDELSTSDSQISFADWITKLHASDATPDDPTWQKSLTDAIERALAALWSSVGINPSIVTRDGMETLDDGSVDLVIDAMSFGGFAMGVARAYEAGVPIDFQGMFTGENRRRISIPNYPFQRRRHWV